MSSTVSQVYIDEFNAQLRQLAQQKYARLRPKIMEVSSGAETYSFSGSKLLTQSKSILSFCEICSGVPPALYQWAIFL